MASSTRLEEASAIVPYAGLFSRIVACLVDWLLELALLLLVAFSMRYFRSAGFWTPVGADSGGFDPERTWHALGAGSKLLIVLAFAISQGMFYQVFLEASPWRATVGKRLLKIYVTDGDGQRISLPRSFGRWFAMWFFGFWGGYFISMLTIPTTKKHQALHDMAAGTRVIGGTLVPAEPIEAWRLVAALVLPYVWLIATFMYTL